MRLTRIISTAVGFQEAGDSRQPSSAIMVSVGMAPGSEGGAVSGEERAGSAARVRGRECGAESGDSS